jgi:integrase
MIDLTAARSIATSARELLATTPDYPNQHWLRDQLLRRRIIEAPPPDRPPLPAPKPTTWTLAEATEQYLAEVKRTRREATWRDRRGMLGIAELKPLADRAVGSIQRREVATIVADIHRSGRERHAAHLCEVIRPMWTWLAQDAQQLRSGVLGSDMALLRPPEATNREGEQETTYLPPIAELGRLLALINASVVDQTFSDALLLLLYTVQRRRAVASARAADFVDEADGSMTWQLPPLHRKTGRGKSRTHDLPLPDAVAAMVRRRIEAAAKAGSESPWLFPALRPRRKGDATTHIHADSLTHHLDDLPGVTASPHDLRRGFATHLEEMAGLPLLMLKTVLDHSEGQDPGDVTDVHYSRARRLKPKAAILAEWTGLIEAAGAKVLLGDVSAIKKAITVARSERARLSAKNPRPKRVRGPRKKAA